MFFLAWAEPKPIFMHQATMSLKKIPFEPISSLKNTYYLAKYCNICVSIWENRFQKWQIMDLLTVSIGLPNVIRSSIDLKFENTIFDLSRSPQICLFRSIDRSEIVDRTITTCPVFAYFDSRVQVLPCQVSGFGRVSNLRKKWTYFRKNQNYFLTFPNFQYFFLLI